MGVTAQDGARGNRGERLIEPGGLGPPGENLGVAARRRVAEQHVTERADLELNGRRPGVQRADLRLGEPLHHPPHVLDLSLGHALRLPPFGQRQHGAVAVAADEGDRELRIEESIEALGCQRSGKHVAANDDPLHGPPLDLLEDSLERR